MLSRFAGPAMTVTRFSPLSSRRFQQTLEITDRALQPAMHRGIAIDLGGRGLQIRAFSGLARPSMLMALARWS